jgi:hypothetical protein
MLPIFSACHQKGITCGLKSAGSIQEDENKIILRNLTISDTAKCYLKNVVIERDSSSIIPLPFATINILTEEKDSLKCITDMEGECNLLISPGRNRLFLNYLSIYKLDTTINFEKGIIVKLKIEVNKQSNENIKTTILTYPYRIPDLFKNK